MPHISSLNDIIQDVPRKLNEIDPVYQLFEVYHGETYLGAFHISFDGGEVFFAGARLVKAQDGRLKVKW